jgi:hypothetical protein
LGIVIVDCSTKPALGYVQTVPDRSAGTLLPIIQRVVRSGTVIHSDEWLAYNKLSSFGFAHNKICHKYHFVCPETGIHTQNVESYNNKIKIEIKKRKGMCVGQHEDFFKEFMFKERFSCDYFSELNDLVKL